MGISRVIVSASQANPATVITSTTETAAITSGLVASPVDADSFLIICTVCVLTGTGQSTVNLNLRRGSGVAGTIVGTVFQWIGTATQTPSLTGMWFDSPGVIDRLQWTLTVTQAGGAGNGLINSCGIAVFAL